LREPVSLLTEDYIVNKYSEELGSDYQAYYRTIENMIKIFQNAGFELLEHNPFFEDGSPLNNRKETRRYGFLLKYRL
jgi:hypothetical protein